MTMESMAPPVTHQTLAAWRSTLVKLRDEERRHAVGLSLETGRLLEIVGQARRGEWRLRYYPLGLIVGDRNLWRQRLHLLPAEQRFHLVLRQVTPVWITKRDPLLPREPDPPRRPGVRRESIPGRLAAESSLGCALFDVVLPNDRRR
jgi:hypothetical protein